MLQSLSREIRSHPGRGESIRMTESRQERCSLCRNRSEQLFSNRPLHKGRERTLLICPDCLESAAASVSQADTQKGACSWCGGGERSASLPAGFSICTSCIYTCRSILGR